MYSNGAPFDLSLAPHKQGGLDYEEVSFEIVDIFNKTIMSIWKKNIYLVTISRYIFKCRFLFNIGLYNLYCILFYFIVRNIYFS